MKGTISDDTVRILRAGEWLWDREIVGFGAKCTVKSKRIVFVFQYRSNDTGGKSKSRRYTIGKYASPWTCDTARREALNLKWLIVHGKPLPKHEYPARARQFIIRNLAEEMLKDAEGRVTRGTWDGYSRTFRKYILPAFGDRTITSLKRREIRAWHQSLGGLPRRADQSLAVLSILFNWTDQAHDINGLNPCRLVAPLCHNQKEEIDDHHRDCDSNASVGR